MLKFKLFFSLGILLFVSCQSREEQLYNERFWKHSGGLYLGDLLIFNKGMCEFKNDTIYIDGMSKAVVLDIENRIISSDKVLHIKDVSSHEKGSYVSK